MDYILLQEETDIIRHYRANLRYHSINSNGNKTSDRNYKSFSNAYFADSLTK